MEATTIEEHKPTTMAQIMFKANITTDQQELTVATTMPRREREVRAQREDSHEELQPDAATTPAATTENSKATTPLMPTKCS